MFGDFYSFRRAAHFFGCAAALLLAGCQREHVRSYRVPKEAEPLRSPHAAHGTPSAAPTPQLVWKTPAGWEEAQPGELRLASFTVKSADGKHQADVSIIPLPGAAGGDLANVNRWRSQVGLPPVKEEELAKLGEKVEIAGQAAQLFDQGGQNPSANERSRILAVILHREGTAWFFKMSGDDALVAQQKPAFVEFLKSMHFHAPGDGHDHAALPPDHPPVGSTGGQGASSGDAKPKWKVPSGWQEQAPGPMQTAKFLATGESGAKAEASVAVIPGDGGGTLANVNRWRKQIGLGPIEADELEKQTSPLDVGGSKVRVLDATSEDRTKRLLAVGVPRAGSTWFYKLMGDAAVVAREREAFLQFVQSAQ